MRGEYPISRNRYDSLSELPPRARRIPCGVVSTGATVGTTSACAENTAPHHSRGFAQWNYLRVRGEYARVAALNIRVVELPPRARRILHEHGQDRPLIGTTSACAENTGKEVRIMSSPRNYLRVRGEYDQLAPIIKIDTELPPRARRIPGRLG